MVESGPTLGEFLRQAREQRGITIEQVASATKIGVRLLHSLEADHYADLPAKPFIRGFVTSYARFVGLDPKEILTRYSEFLEDKVLDRPNRESGHSGYAFDRKEGEQSRTILGLVMGGFVLAGGLLIFVFKPSLHPHRGSHLDKLRAAHPAATEGTLAANPPVAEASPAALPSPEPLPVVAPSAAAISKPVPSPLVVTQPSSIPASVPVPATQALPDLPKALPSPDAKPDHLNTGASLSPKEIKHKVIFKALANVWVRYQVDERPMMKFILKKDKLLVLKAQKNIRIQISNPNSVTYNYNGHHVEGEEVGKSTAMRQDNPTLFFPLKDAQVNQVPFPGEKRLPATPDPVVDVPAPVATPDT